VRELFIADVKTRIDVFSCAGHHCAVELDEEGHEAGEEGGAPFCGGGPVEGVEGVGGVGPVSGFWWWWG
jgi:hypothetical protein